MCYYNGVKVTRAEYIRLKNLEKLVANYNFLVKPLSIGFEYGTQAVLKPIDGKEDFDIVEMEWGFIPPKIPNRAALERFRKGGINANTGKFEKPFITLNAIGEELFQKTSYKEAALSRRCLVLSSGFYEWRHHFPLSKKTGKPLKTAVKYPYHISLVDKEYFFMAGIWTPWTDKQTGEYVESVAILTAGANGMMKQVHNSKERMPVILNEDLAFEWMFDALDEKRVTEIAATQYPAAEMQAYSIRKDFLHALDPKEAFVYPELPPLEIAA
ncbi:MAG TPA: SOS response-associated peptidase family protein [Phnomibacter sp.]|nr:SOS response-associated peptidase family protein [Phnomibacter sp.]